MASPQRHLRQWKHNRDFVATIDPHNSDWIVTGVFYTALHAIDAMLAYDHAGTITNHERRNSVLEQTKVYEPVWEKYDPLYGLARSIRYFANPQTWVRFEDIDEKILEGLLYPIESFVFTRIGLDPATTARPIKLKSPEIVTKPIKLPAQQPAGISDSPPTQPVA